MPASKGKPCIETSKTVDRRNYRQMKVLFICTSNKDRSRALEDYFKEVHPENEYRSAGVNKYFTQKHRTHYLTVADPKWASLIVYAEEIHYKICERDFPGVRVAAKDCRILSIGDYSNMEDYLTVAQEKLHRHFKSGQN